MFVFHPFQAIIRLFGVNAGFLSGKEGERGICPPPLLPPFPPSLGYAENIFLYTVQPEIVAVN